MLRSVLVAGATAVIQQARRAAAVHRLAARTAGAQVVAEARSDSVANKIARIGLEAVVTGESYHAGASRSHRARRVKEIGGAAAFGSPPRPVPEAARGDGRIDRSECETLLGPIGL